MGADRQRQEGLLLSGKCKRQIRLNYNISIRTKRTKIIATRHVLRAQNIPKCVCGRSSVPDPTRRAYSAAPVQLARLRRGGHWAGWTRREEMGRKGRRNKVRNGKEGRGKKRKGRGRTLRTRKNFCGSPMGKSNITDGYGRTLQVEHCYISSHVCWRHLSIVIVLFLCTHSPSLFCSINDVVSQCFAPTRSEHVTVEGRLGWKQLDGQGQPRSRSVEKCSA